ncbi:MAG: hypothetical protein QM564_07160 [Bergeyella sp.]
MLVIFHDEDEKKGAKHQHLLYQYVGASHLTNTAPVLCYQYITASQLKF